MYKVIHYKTDEILLMTTNKRDALNELKLESGWECLAVDESGDILGRGINVPSIFTIKGR